MFTYEDYLFKYTQKRTFPYKIALTWLLQMAATTHNATSRILDNNNRDGGIYIAVRAGTVSPACLFAPGSPTQIPTCALQTLPAIAEHNNDQPKIGQILESDSDSISLLSV